MNSLMELRKLTAVRLAKIDGWTNRAHIGVFVKGYLAAFNGKSLKDCPYRHTPGGGAYNGSFAWPKAWKGGFLKGKSVVRMKNGLSEV